MKIVRVGKRVVVLGSKKASSELRYRAVKARFPYNKGDNTSSVGPWRKSMREATHDATRDFAPHRRAEYLIESTAGTLKLLGETWAQNAEALYHRSMKG